MISQPQIRSGTAQIVALGAMLACMLLGGRPCALALDPSLDVNQYAHTAWKIREGFCKGFIYSIAQTPDGYLWLATEFGLFRFDGVRNVPWRPPPGQHLPSSTVMSLLAARDGTLWIGTRNGLASWRNGKLTQYPEFVGQTIVALLEDREGAVWTGAWMAPTGRLCTIQNGSIHCYGEDGAFGLGVFNLFEDSSGRLWVGVQDGLWRWKPDAPIFYALPGEQGGIRGLGEDSDGALLIGMGAGIKRFVNGKTEAYLLPDGVPRFQTRRLLRDRDGGLWIGTQDRGLVHVHQGKTDVFATSDGLTGDDVLNLFQDREGTVWATTLNGLDRFRDFAVVTLSAKQGLSNARVGSVLADRDGAVWLGTTSGLNRWSRGQIRVFSRQGGGGKLEGLAPESLLQDDRGRIWVSTRGGAGYLEGDRFISIHGVPGGIVHSFAEDSAGNIWIANMNLGLFRLRHGSVAQQIPWDKLGHKDYATAVAGDRVRGGLWLGFVLGGVSYFKDGEVRASYTVADGLASGRVNSFYFQQDGTLWAATEGGLSRLKDESVATLNSESGLPCDAVHWVMEDDAHSYWLYMTCGLVRIGRPELDAWVAAVDKNKDAKGMVQATIFDSSDGVRGIAIPTRSSPLVAKSSDGKLWFLPVDGVSVVDPHHVPFNRLPPPVHIEQITADHKTYEATADANGQVRLPPLTRDLEIDYTALSLVAPEKVFFRYKLEGRDVDWQDPLTRRQAFYSDLRPGKYRFRVIACNNDGVWNEVGATQDFRIAPAWYQNTWFRLLCMTVFGFMIWAVYQWRIRQLRAHLDSQFEARLLERTRIAQELHDTLLQGVLSASIQLDLANEELEAQAPAKPLVVRVLELMRQVVEDGRAAVRGLRVFKEDTQSLDKAFLRIPEELGFRPSSDFRVIVEGSPRALHPVIRDEVYRIGREATVNALRHSRARNIEAVIEYGVRELRLSVRDDGSGVDPNVLQMGRDGHWGLSGMRERAEKIGAKLKVWSSSANGTEIELSVPSRIAYESSPPSRTSKYLAKLYDRKKPGANSHQGQQAG